LQCPVVGIGWLQGLRELHSLDIGGDVMRSLLTGFCLFVFSTIGCSSQGPNLRSEIHPDMESFNAAASPEYSTPAMRDAQLKEYMAYQEQMQKQGQQNAAGPGREKSTSLFGN
jgi:hypothetical protein